MRGKIEIVTKPKWWNRQTRTTQNRVGLAHEGSTPSFGTNKFSP